MPDNIPYRWQPLQDLDPDHAQLGVRELQVLAEVWAEQRSQFKGRETYTQFETRLKREWAIETGLIEGLYTLDRGVTQLLIKHGIQAALIPSEQAANSDWLVATMNDHESAVDGLFDFVKGNRSLSTSYIKELHALMTRRQKRVEGVDSFGRPTSVKLLHGAYKKLPNNPNRASGLIHEYCPPEHVASEMDELIRLHHEHNNVAPEVEAAWLHHRFTQIHPFQDGNGRIARALATLVFIKAQWFPLVVRDKDRKVYLDALETADHGDLRPLVRYFAKLQRSEFVRALSIAEDIRKERRYTEALKALSLRVQRQRDWLTNEWKTAKSTAQALHRQAYKRLEKVADDLRGEIGGVLKHSEFFADDAPDGSPRDHYFKYQIIQAARALDYFANFTIYSAWTRLVLKNTTRAEMLVAFHGIGRDFRGVLTCSALLFQRLETDDGEHEIGPIQLLADTTFLISYKEPLEEIKARFGEWLEGAVLECFRYWQDIAL